MTTIDPEIRKRRLATALKWGLGFLGAIVISPFVALALKGALGAIAFLVAGIVGVGIMRLTPWLSMKWSNLVMQLIVREAEKNPIETMQNLYIEKTGELEEADRAIVNFDAEVRNYDDETAAFSKKYPDEAESYREVSQQMHMLLQQQKDEQQIARARLEDLKERIRKAEAHYKMALAAQRVTAFSRSVEARVFQEIKEKVAFDSVRTELNRAFAQLSMTVNQKVPLAALPAVNHEDDLIVPAPETKSKVPITVRPIRTKE